VTPSATAVDSSVVFLLEFLYYFLQCRVVSAAARNEKSGNGIGRRTDSENESFARRRHVVPPLETTANERARVDARVRHGAANEKIFFSTRDFTALTRRLRDASADSVDTLETPTHPSVDSTPDVPSSIRSHPPISDLSLARRRPIAPPWRRSPPVFSPPPPRRVRLDSIDATIPTPLEAPPRAVPARARARLCTYRSRPSATRRRARASSSSSSSAPPPRPPRTSRKPPPRFASTRPARPRRARSRAR